MHTSRYIVKRIILAAVSLFAIITLTFFLMNLMPGDPFMSEKATEENRAILIAKYGLDQPVYVQYGKYLINLFQGDMGTSYVLQKGRAVKDIIFESFAVSMQLGLKALVVALITGSMRKREKMERRDYPRLFLASVLAALTYVLLYMLKTFVFGLTVNGLTLEGTFAKMGAKLPASLINAVFAAVVSPLFYLAVKPALRHMDALRKM